MEKRFGIGFTINLGNPKAKVIAVVTAALVAAMLIGMFAIFLAFDTAAFPPVIENGIVTINAPLYSDAFALDEMREIEENPEYSHRHAHQWFGEQQLAHRPLFPQRLWEQHALRL